MPRPKHLIFDLDGTLVNSAFVIASVLNEMRSERGLFPLGLSKFTYWISLGADELVCRALEVHGEAMVDQLSDFRRRYSLLATPLDSVYPGVELALSNLAEKGILFSICTNKPRPLAEKVLAETGLAKYFPFICAGGDLPAAKPAPGNLFACVNHFGIPAATYFVGDSVIDQICARNAGIPFIFHRNGYDDGVDESKAEASFADYFNFYTLILAV